MVWALGKNNYYQINHEISSTKTYSEPIQLNYF